MTIVSYIKVHGESIFSCGRSIGHCFQLCDCFPQVPSRTVKELVEFYYLWKKSERYDLFVQRYGKIGRKKVVVPPGHV